MGARGPKIPEIDFQQVVDMLYYGSPLREVADYFQVEERAIERVLKRFGAQTKTGGVSRQKRAESNYRLRKSQFELAFQGNAVMNIWLGKNRLGQSEKAEVTHLGDGQQPLLVRIIHFGSTGASDVPALEDNSKPVIEHDST